MKKSGLGKGLSALIPTAGADDDESGLTHDGVSTAATVPTPDSSFESVSVADIEPNRYQPRRIFDDESMAELTASIQQVGILQPLLLRKVDGGYEIVAGERRWRAARRAGLTRVPAVVRATADRDSLEQAIIENLHRDDLNPIDEAAAFHRLMDEFGLTQHQVAMRVSRSRPAIANSLRLLHLPDDVQQMIMDGRLSAGHARALAGLGDRQLLEQLAMRVVDEGMSVRQTEEMVRALGDVSVPDPDQVDDPVVKPQDAAFLEVEQILSDRFDTTVRVHSRGRKGRIVVEFADQDDLQRLFGLLGG
ncbi:MAG: ParB/RepB/Spo0J family partition protein [Acidimicrobiales bacterium]|nr:ParB/RepB/Spo0J family partition protein [Acidimicrobiales bacterium]